MDLARLWVGIDWGVEFHQVCVLDAEGKSLEQRKFFHTSASLMEMVAWLTALAKGEPRSAFVAIERPHGAIVELLLQHDMSVHSLNPKQLDRFRDRHTVAGAKDDRRDAFVLADSLRTDSDAFSRLRIEDSIVVNMREMIRVDEDLRIEENGLQNRLREQLLRYFPAMLTLIADRADPFLWSLLELAHNHDDALSLSEETIAALLRKYRLRRLTVEKVRAAFQTPKLQVSQATINAASAHLQLLIPRLRLVHLQRQHCGQKIEAFLQQLACAVVPLNDGEEPRPPRLADVEILQSLPGVGRIVVATMLVEAVGPIARRDLHGIRTLGGIAPVTRRSGKQNLKVMRRACNARLRYALYHWGRTAMQRDPPTKHHYTQLRAKGHSHGRALRGVVDRLLSVAIAMLKSHTRYDPSQRQRSAKLVSLTP